jgi:hypothetical protein
MKTPHSVALVKLLALVALLGGCSKAVESTEELPPLEPASLDANAGQWEMLVLGSSSQFDVAPPAPVDSDAYRAELAALQEAQGKLTQKQRDLIAYWSGGGVLRWNQLLRELVARYNLQPPPNADGSYPAPDAENPFAEPNFPFANPPYAARAYSYVSVGQYEALKAAWHFKFRYNRPAPHAVEGGVALLRPDSGLPAYPSEDAVLSAVTAELLKALFPAAVEEITRRAADQRNAALWSGRASASDIAAGLALGKAVAEEMKRRAATDGMSRAAGTKVDWQRFEEECRARGETPWLSLELPLRPPMLPMFGKVRPWNMTTEELVRERPAPPHSTSSEEMKRETEEVKWYADHVTRERLAIVHKWADGAGTYTPPGHWNDIAAESIRDARFSEVRAARAFALLNMALHDAAVGCWDAKYTYFNPRPSQLDTSIKTCTGVPNFPSFTSGHSTFSGAAATVLSHLFPEQGESFHRAAEEASVSRLYAGIHYRSDIEVGLTHGKVIGGYAVRRALEDGAD